jgi:hypothetical protein
MIYGARSVLGSSETAASLHLVGSVLNHKDQKTTAGYAYFSNQGAAQSAG